jgi:hypothetical protein
MFPVAVPIDDRSMHVEQLDQRVCVDLYYDGECRSTDVSRNALHWQQLARAAIAATSTTVATLTFIVGACYSGGMFGVWLLEHSPAIRNILTCIAMCVCVCVCVCD